MMTKRTEAYGKMRDVLALAANITGSSEAAIDAQRINPRSLGKISLFFDVALPEADNELFRTQSAELRAELASIDELTGLPNKHIFMSRIAEWRDGQADQNAAIAIAYLDINGMKEVNDTYLHSAGDLLVACFAEALKDVLRKDDVISRFHGDEFAVALPEMRSGNEPESAGFGSFASVEEFEQKLKERIRNSSLLEGLDGPLVEAIRSLDFGIGAIIYTAKELGETPLREVLDAVDRRMYVNKQAKKTGAHQLVQAETLF